jgi:hypothetical protein
MANACAVSRLPWTAGVAERYARQTRLTLSIHAQAGRWLSVRACARDGRDDACLNNQTSTPYVFVSTYASATTTLIVLTRETGRAQIVHARSNTRTAAADRCK